MKKLTHKQKLLAIFIIAIIAAFLQFILQKPLYAQIIITIVGALIALSMLIEMIKTIRSGKYGIDLLAIIAVVSTLSIGEYWASMIILLMLVGGDTLEDYAANKANSELKALLDNTPQTAHVLSEGKISDIDVEKVNVDDIVVVKPGEMVPIDGVIIKGNSEFDESSLTGESNPITKVVGDNVMSGSINGDTSVSMKVTKLASESEYQRLVQLVKEAESTPSNFVRMADRYAVPFTIIAIVIGTVATIISRDIVRFAEVMVVASPCPLILAAPIAMVSGMSRASRNGIIVKNGTVIEKLSNTKTAAFDKTGTITVGQLTLDKVVPMNNLTSDEFIRYAASAEQESNHILARSIVSHAQQQGVSSYEVTDLQEVVGKGISAKINGHEVKIGRFNFVNSSNQTNPVAQTAVHMSIDNQYQGYISFIDSIRPEAQATMQELKNHGVEQLIMVTGDQENIAQTVAEKVGITNVNAGLLPEDKISVIRNISQSQRPVLMVGDGVNDAPVLATSDIGIAMGAHGSTAASESADIVIVKDDLSKVATAVDISQDTIKVARQSVLIGIFICTALMLIASVGVIPALIGALFQEVIDFTSIMWALRARRDSK